MIAPGGAEREHADDARDGRVRFRPERDVGTERMSGDDDGQMVGSQLVKRTLDEGRNIVRQDAVAQKSGIRPSIEKLLYIESDHRIAVGGETLSELLMCLPESKIIAKKENAGFWMSQYSKGGIEEKRLAPQLPVARGISWAW